MNKNNMLCYVTQLQELRERFDNETYFLQRPIDHCRVNFGVAIDRALEAVMQVYSDLVLEEIQNRKEASHE